MVEPPTQEQLLALLARHGSVPFEAIRAHPQGKIFDVDPMQVLPAADDAARFDVAPADVSDELAALSRESALHAAIGLPPHDAESCTHLLAVRRVREVQNKMYQHLDAIRKRMPDNPAWVHPDDLAALGVASGEPIEIRSAHGCIVARAEADETLRRGVVSITHGFDTCAEAGAPGNAGVNVNRLTSATLDREPINAMPRLTALPVRLRRAPSPDPSPPSSMQRHHP
jgi:anaerobic selenocysteine-containing dehydrogenase